MKREVGFFDNEDCAAARRKMDQHGLQVLPVVNREMRIVGLFTHEEIEEKGVRALAKKPASVPPARPAFEA